MIIETQFNVGDFVYTINNNRIVKLKVIQISYVNNQIEYHLLVRKAPTTLDKDIVITKSWEYCFLRIDNLADYYKNEIEIRQKN